MYTRDRDRDDLNSMHVIGVIITHILQCMRMINKTVYLEIDSRIYVNLKIIIKLKSNLIFSEKCTPEKSIE